MVYHPISFIYIFSKIWTSVVKVDNTIELKKKIVLGDNPINMKSKLHMLDLRFASLLLKRISFSRDQMRISNSVLTTKELCLKRWLSGPKLYDIRQVYMASSNSHIKPMIVSNWNQTDDNIWWQVHKFNSHAHITSNNKQKNVCEIFWM